MFKQTAATATLAACVVLVLVIMGPFFGHTMFDTPVSLLSPEYLLEPWTR